jgi:hypothetical protein
MKAKQGILGFPTTKYSKGVYHHWYQLNGTASRTWGLYTCQPLFPLKIVNNY